MTAERCHTAGSKKGPIMGVKGLGSIGKGIGRGPGVPSWFLALGPWKYDVFLVLIFLLVVIHSVLQPRPHCHNLLMKQRLIQLRSCQKPLSKELDYAHTLLSDLPFIESVLQPNDTRSLNGGGKAINYPPIPHSEILCHLLCSGEVERSDWQTLGADQELNIQRSCDHSLCCSIKGNLYI